MGEVQETLQLRFNLGGGVEKILTWEDWEVLEMAQDGEMRVGKLRPLLARLMLNQDGTPMDFKQAMKVLGKVHVVDIADVVQQFTKALSDVAVPKEKRNESSDSSPVAEEEFPDG